MTQIAPSYRNDTSAAENTASVAAIVSSGDNLLLGFIAMVGNAHLTTINSVTWTPDGHVLSKAVDVGDAIGARRIAIFYTTKVPATGISTLEFSISNAPTTYRCATMVFTGDINSKHPIWATYGEFLNSVNNAYLGCRGLKDSVLVHACMTGNTTVSSWSHSNRFSLQVGIGLMHCQTTEDLLLPGEAMSMDFTTNPQQTAQAMIAVRPSYEFTPPCVVSCEA